MTDLHAVILCPGQGAQAVGMGKAWHEASEAARRIFAQADEALGESLDRPLSEICFNGPADLLNRTDIAQPAIYVCSVACHRGLVERNGQLPLTATAGLSLGEYTALCLAGVFDFVPGLRLVARRGRLMQEAAQRCRSGMVAVAGADQEQAQAICDEARGGDVLVCANVNAPSQIVLSGHADACQRAADAAGRRGLRATPLAVAGAFHSPLMQSAADGMATALDHMSFQPPKVRVWSNVTAQPHHPQDMELLKRRLVEQIVSPVRWSEICHELVGGGTMSYHELAPGVVLRGLMRRIDRNVKVTNHDQP
ncbi:MAG: ACP S-malonyltransferase [Planctomycetota bacterium]|nr:ACP S-malonyltransferase [Planctomycetota bacterium]